MASEIKHIFETKVTKDQRSIVDIDKDPATMKFYGAPQSLTYVFSPAKPKDKIFWNSPYSLNYKNTYFNKCIMPISQLYNFSDAIAKQEKTEKKAIISKADLDNVVWYDDIGYFGTKPVHDLDGLEQPVYDILLKRYVDLQTFLYTRLNYTFLPNIIKTDTGYKFSETIKARSFANDQDRPNFEWFNNHGDQLAQAIQYFIDHYKTPDNQPYIKRLNITRSNNTTRPFFYNIGGLDHFYNVIYYNYIKYIEDIPELKYLNDFQPGSVYIDNGKRTMGMIKDTEVTNFYKYLETKVFHTITDKYERIKNITKVLNRILIWIDEPDNTDDVLKSKRKYYNTFETLFNIEGRGLVQNIVLDKRTIINARNSGWTGTMIRIRDISNKVIYEKVIPNTNNNGTFPIDKSLINVTNVGKNPDQLVQVQTLTVKATFSVGERMLNPGTLTLTLDPMNFQTPSISPTYWIDRTRLYGYLNGYGVNDSTGLLTDTMATPTALEFKSPFKTVTYPASSFLTSNNLNLSEHFINAPFNVNHNVSYRMQFGPYKWSPYVSGTVRINSYNPNISKTFKGRTGYVEIPNVVGGNTANHGSCNDRGYSGSTVRVYNAAGTKVWEQFMTGFKFNIPWQHIAVNQNNKIEIVPKTPSGVLETVSVIYNTGPVTVSFSNPVLSSPGMNYLNSDNLLCTIHNGSVKFGTVVINDSLSKCNQVYYEVIFNGVVKSSETLTVNSLPLNAISFKVKMPAEQVYDKSYTLRVKFNTTGYGWSKLVSAYIPSLMTTQDKKDLDALNLFSKTTHAHPLDLEKDYAVNFEKYLTIFRPKFKFDTYSYRAPGEWNYVHINTDFKKSEDNISADLSYYGGKLSYTLIIPISIKTGIKFKDLLKFNFDILKLCNTKNTSSYSIVEISNTNPWKLSGMIKLENTGLFPKMSTVYNNLKFSYFITDPIKDKLESIYDLPDTFKVYYTAFSKRKADLYRANRLYFMAKMRYTPKQLVNLDYVNVIKRDERVEPDIVILDGGGDNITQPQLQDLHVINYCISCGVCVDECPTKALDFIGSSLVMLDKNKCVKCDACVKVCPERLAALDLHDAIYIKQYT